MNEKKKLQIIGAMLIVFLILLGTLFKFYLKKESQCQDNPLIYGAKVYAEKGVEITCLCEPINAKYLGFVFDKDNITVNEQIPVNPYSIPFGNVNFSINN